MALGRAEEAADRYADRPPRAPPPFYMTQAYARLADVDRDRARRALGLGRLARVPRGAFGFLTRAHEELRLAPSERARAALGR